MSHIFISYAREDIDFVRYLRTLLQQAGFTVWVDERLAAGDDWWDTIEQSITGAAAFLIVMSPYSRQSKWARRELLLAEERDCPVIPVLLSGDPWSQLADIQFEDMQRGVSATLSPEFVTRLRRVTGQHGSGSKAVTVRVVQGDIREAGADVLALKYARRFMGADWAVAKLLLPHLSENELTPETDSYRLLNTRGLLPAAHVLFVSMPNIFKMQYQDNIRFSRLMLEILAAEAPDTRHVAMPIHGPGIGRDAAQSFRAQFQGVLEALQSGLTPPALELLTVIELKPKRVEQYRETLAEILDGAEYAEALADGTGYHLTIFQEDDITPAAAPAAPSAFVVMPDDAAFEDILYFGIEKPVHSFGLLCEYTGQPAADADLLAQFCQQIDAASLVIVDLTIPTPDRYFYLGYALGQQKPVRVLLGDDATPDMPLPAPLCIPYRRIKDVEQAIHATLNKLQTEHRL